LGYLYRYRLGDLDRAEKAFAEVIDRSDGPARAAALAELSDLAALRGNWIRVIELDQRRVEGEGDAGARADILTRIGEVREREIDDSDGAGEAYAQAIQADASFMPALEGAGRVFSKHGTIDKLVWMHRAEAASAPSPGERAWALLRAGELLAARAATLDEGIVVLTEAHAAAPTARALFDALEQALRRKGAWEQLCALYRSEIDRGVEPDRATWLQMQIGELAAVRLGDTRRAIEAFGVAAGIEGGRMRYALSRLAQLLEDSDAPSPELDAVLGRLAALTDSPAEQASFLEHTARLQEKRGDVEAALASYRRAVELAPLEHTVHTAAGRAFHRAERWDELLALFERALAHGDADERAHNAYKAGSLLARQLGRVDDGIKYLQQALALAPRHLPARLLLAALYTEAQRWEELAPVLAQLPPTPTRLARRAALAEAGGRLDEALSLWEAAALAGVTLAGPARARLYARLGRWNELAELHERVSANGVGRNVAVDARYRAAELRLERLGERERAVELLAAALAAEPDAFGLLLARERALGSD
ncbi:MAG TPA: tetratricopeptide repeat protein, partial [Polyangia bacterium]